MDAVYVHDAAALAAVIQPSLFEWQRGKVLVVSEGPARGRTVLDECECAAGDTRQGRRAPVGALAGRCGGALFGRVSTWLSADRVWRCAMPVCV